MDRPGSPDHSALKLLGLLLVLNLGVLVAGLVMQNWAPAASEPVVFNAEKIRLLALKAPLETDASNSTEPDPDIEPVPVLPSPPTAPASSEPMATARCWQWDSLDPDQLLEVESRLERIGVTPAGYRIDLEKTLGWWVFLPPHKNRAELEVAINKVRSLGIRDFAPIRGGAMLNALSLGTFSLLGQAREHAASLASKGVNGVRYGPRPESGMARLVFSDTLAERTVQLAASGWTQSMQPKACEVLP